MPLSKISIIANPHARGGNPQKIEAVAKRLSKHIPTHISWTKAPGHASELARKAGADPDTLVVACGGDGSIYEALNGLPSSGVLGILPNGTANVIAREFGIPLELFEAAKILLTGALKPIDTGMVEGQKFLMVAGFGFDAAVAASVHPAAKRILGQYAYHLEVARQYAFYQHPRLSISVDGARPIEGVFALFANMRRYGGGLFFAPEARYDDGELDLVLFKSFTLPYLMKGFHGAISGRGVPKRVAHRVRGKHFLLTSDRPVACELDGEVLPPVIRAEIMISPNDTKMVVP